MGNMTRHFGAPLEDEAEFLATRWMSVKQFEEAGEVWPISFRDDSELHPIRNFLSQGPVHKSGDTKGS